MSSENMRPAVRVHGLAKRYDLSGASAPDTLGESLARLVRWPRRRARPEPLWALRDVSFAVESGEVLGIIGANGAGKSTLLRIISRITAPTRGRMELRGRVGSLLEVGTGFHPELSGRENVFLNGAILGMRAAEIARKFDEIVEFSGVGRFIDEPVKHYSSGMSVRLAFAVAAHLEPEVLLVDEVLAVGDAAFQKKCLGRMANVARGGRTILFVSHDLGAVSALCDRVLYLRDGTVRALGSAAEVLATYLADIMEPAGDDLERLRPQGFGARARFTSVALATADGVRVSPGAPLTFRFTVAAAEDVKGVTAGLSVFNALGRCVGTTFTRETMDLAAGERRAWRITLMHTNLAPGSYSAGFSLGWGGRGAARQDLDVVVGRPVFEVRGSLGDDDGASGWAPQWGDILFRDVELAPDD
jgi:lipopolysaccharide transport system ATP-binding protein